VSERGGKRRAWASGGSTCRIRCGAIRRTLSALLFLASIAVEALPATAHILEVSTSVTLAAAATDDALKDALAAAATDVLRDVAPLQPAVMAITAAYLTAGRLYVRFLIADEAGARLLGLEADPTGQEPHPSGQPQGYL
jgi:hypothetical protein